jgi:hypothetical protein
MKATEKEKVLLTPGDASKGPRTASSENACEESALTRISAQIAQVNKMCARSTGAYAGAGTSDSHRARRLR